jgi:hypothetical protein
MNSESGYSPAETAHIEAAKQYYIRADAGRPDTAELFADDVQIYFPKFGVVKGKRALGELGAGLMKYLASIAHDLSSFKFVARGDTVVVEGFTRGSVHSGESWAGGKTPGGRFCSVFEFRGELISRMHIYLDPDYVSQDEGRFHWGRSRQW